jgi:hypothetical protein
MGYKLRREVRDSIPPRLLSPAERNVILEIADLHQRTGRCARRTESRVRYAAAGLPVFLLIRSSVPVRATVPGAARHPERG